MKNLVLTLALLVPTGCVCNAVQDQVKVTAAAHDGYARKITEGIAELTTADRAGLTLRTRRLLNETIKAVYKSRRAWHKANFALNDGPDPATLDLDSIPSLSAE